MARDKEPKSSRQGKLDRFAKVLPTSTGAEGGPTPLPDNAAILQAIHASGESLEGKMAEIHLEVTLLRHDLRKVSERVTEAEHLRT